MMGRTLFVALVLVTVCLLGSADAYQFKLLNGMKINGALKNFEDGRFYVVADVGEVAIDADKLDYIVVEATDPGPCVKTEEQGTPGLGLCHTEPPNVKDMGLTRDPEPEAPAPLMGHSVPPALESHSVRPAPFGTFSVNPARAYPGLFRGENK